MGEAPKPFNPLDKRILGSTVAEALLGQPVLRLPPDQFLGAGIYAIYYVGDFDDYAPIAERNREGRFEVPIYVGKAMPRGARKGRLVNHAAESTSLHERLGDHSTSIRQVSNLKIGDFYCRYLVADEVWIPLGESVLISRLEPVWNLVVSGFGNNPVGDGRAQQRKSAWDLIHPGREWALPLPEPKVTTDQVKESLRRSLAKKYGAQTPTGS